MNKGDLTRAPGGHQAEIPARATVPARAAVLALLLMAAVTLNGCAVYAKCGFGGCPGDAKTTADVEASFAQHPAIMPPNWINIRSLDGVVYLSGLVDTDLQRQLAESVARATPGVKRVVNSIGLAGNSGY